MIYVAFAGHTNNTLYKYQIDVIWNVIYVACAGHTNNTLYKYQIDVIWNVIYVARAGHTNNTLYKYSVASLIIASEKFCAFSVFYTNFYFLTHKTFTHKNLKLKHQ